MIINKTEIEVTYKIHFAGSDYGRSIGYPIEKLEDGDGIIADTFDSVKKNALEMFKKLKNEPSISKTNH